MMFINGLHVHCLLQSAMVRNRSNTKVSKKPVAPSPAPTAALETRTNGGPSTGNNFGKFFNAFWFICQFYAAVEVGDTFRMRRDHWNHTVCLLSSLVNY